MLCRIVESAEAKQSGHSDSSTLPLFVGGKLRCPRCHTVRDLLSYFCFDRIPAHEGELNVVYKCRARVDKGGGHIEPCRYVFSPGLTNAEHSRLIEATVAPALEHAHVA